MRYWDRASRRGKPRPERLAMERAVGNFEVEPWFAVDSGSEFGMTDAAEKEYVVAAHTPVVEDHNLRRRGLVEGYCLHCEPEQCTTDAGRVADCMRPRLSRSVDRDWKRDSGRDRRTFC